MLRQVYLIGYRGSGKTSVGRPLAKMLDLPHVDTDVCIEESAGMTIKEIFAREGEAGFRDRESAVIEELAKRASADPHVVSLGGGAVLRPANRNWIQSTGRRIWLTAPVEILYQRITADATTASRRPALSQLNDYEEVISLLAQREPLYRELAEKIVNTAELSAETIAGEIAQWLETKQPSP